MLLKIYLIALAIFLVIDMIWLGVVARNFYAQQLGSLMKPDVNWIAVGIFYPLFILGLCVFVIQPAIAAQSWTQALLMGAFFGLVTYATYDLTNLATLKNWPLMMTVIDLIWGSSLAAVVAVCTYFLTTK